MPPPNINRSILRVFDSVGPQDQHSCVHLGLKGWAGVKQLQEYAQQANECRESAANATTPEVKLRLLKMAERWEELARQRAAQFHLEDVLAELLKHRNGDGGAAVA